LLAGLDRLLITNNRTDLMRDCAQKSAPFLAIIAPVIMVVLSIEL
jgi:hypothetical protein